MTNTRRQPVRSKTPAITRRVVEPETIVEIKPVMSKLRVDRIQSDTSPHNIRDLLEDIGTVGEVSIHSDQESTYALADMPYEEAEDAVEFLDNMLWRGKRITVEFANRADSKRWLSGHDWKPPNPNRW